MGAITSRTGKKGISYKATAITNNQRISKTFSENKYGRRAKTRAKEWITATEAELRQGRAVATATQQRTTLQQTINIYTSKILPTHAAASQPKEKSNLKTILASFSPNTPMAAITPAKMADWAIMLKTKKSRADATIRNLLKQMEWLYRTANIELGAVLPTDSYRQTINILKHRGYPIRPARRSRRIEMMNSFQSELQVLITHNHTRPTIIGKILEFAVETGMRRGEIAALEWRDIDWTKRIATVRHSKTDKQTGEEGRTVPLTQRATEILMSIRQPYGSVFRMKPDSITQAFLRLCRAHNIKNLHFHDFRHEFVTRAHEKLGWKAEKIGTVTGQSVATVERYLHLRAEDMVKEMDQMEGMNG